MTVRLRISEQYGIFFITFTCFNWTPLIELTKCYDTVYKWFDYLKSKGHYVTGYVIMPNHLHALIALKNANQSVNTIVSNAKRFMAYEIIKRLKNQQQNKLLHQLSTAVSAPDRNRGKLHQVFQPSFNCKECFTEAFTQQKLTYMHENPCKGKWNLAVSPGEFKHSSAGYYLTGQHGEYEVTNYMELMDVDLSK